MCFTKLYKKRGSDGFTIVEILVVVAVMVVLVGAALSVFPEFIETYRLRSGTQKVITALRDARMYTLSSKEDRQYGLHFSTSTVTIFNGDSYSSSDPENKVISLPEGVKISTTTTSDGGDSILFEQFFGKAEVYGTSTLSIGAGKGVSTTSIIIQKNGLVVSE